KGQVVGVGATCPPGGAHAEVVALAQAGQRACGGIAVVTLEPCHHAGRTGPCTSALIDAGVTEVHFAVSDPNPVASGGANALADKGIKVTSGIAQERVSKGPLREWLHRQRTGRAYFTWKFAASLDGRSAAQDGTSKWITGTAAREHVHARRATVDAIIVGTGTVLTDNPHLTARLPDGTLAAHQPVRVLVGNRDVPTNYKIFDDAAETIHLRTNNLSNVVAALTDYPDVLIEGGPILAGAFMQKGLIDRVQAYLAPVLLGSGPAALGFSGVATIAQALRYERESVEYLGEDIVLTLALQALSGGN
ncbi:MAG: bifunctional diaminohydroxyphosphoribosylaminopyrimidine deaminase/5-amino-6-(5-phosphoribosylamino)uracil reductase RibD, partial [Mycobacteriaceae bacterium]